MTPPAGQAAAATYTLDALGRIGSRTISGVTDTYAYLGTSETVSRITTAGATTDALLGADGGRYATKTATGFGWLVPDLHLGLADASSSSLAAITDALRYDAWGQVTASVTSPLPTPWRYQGRLLVDPSGANDLYDAGARFYSPGLGVFTQLDSVQGGALRPLSLNRYLYAEADPTTLVDPDGHTVACPSNNPDACPGATPAGYSAPLPEQDFCTTHPAECRYDKSPVAVPGPGGQVKPWPQAGFPPPVLPPPRTSIAPSRQAVACANVGVGVGAEVVGSWGIAEALAAAGIAGAPETGGASLTLVLLGLGIGALDIVEGARHVNENLPECMS